MRSDVFVYISGPITAQAIGARTVEQNVEAGLEVYWTCLRQGIPAFCPHAAALHASSFSVLYEDWLAYDFEVINRCSHVLLMAGWEQSKGCRLEKVYAERIGKPIIYSLEEL